MTFDGYVQGFGKVSLIASAISVLTTAVIPCGALLGGFLFLPHVAALILALGFPLLFHWLKKDWPPLASDARRWSWFALGAAVASVPLMLLFDHSGNEGCFR